MKFSCNFQRHSMFHSADLFLPNRKISTKLCSNGFWEPRTDSQVRLASRLKINGPYGGLLTSGFTGKLNGHLLPRKLESVPLVVFKLSCQGKYSLGDINGVIDLSMALDDEAARVWIDVNQTLSELQETAAEESWVNEAGQIATMEVALAKTRLCALLKAGDKEEVIISAQNEVKEWLAKLTSFQDRLRNLKTKKDKLLKEAKRLKEAAKRKHTSALEAEEAVTELMIWTEPSVVNDAENKSLFGDKTHERNQSKVFVREATELEEANHELEAIRSRNFMISKGIDQLISLEEEAAHAWNDANKILHLVQEMIAKELVAKEPVQKAVIILSMGKESSKNDIKQMLENIASLQDRFSCMQEEKYELIKEANRLNEAAKRAQKNVLEAEEEVMDMMIWGEQAMRLEHEAIRRLGDAETALKIAEKSHGEVLLREATKLDEANQELDEANQELEAIRSRNYMISKGIDQLMSLEEESAHAWNDANQTLHVVQETIAEECVAKESVQKAVITLSLSKESSENEMLENLASLQERLMCLQMKKYELMKEANRLSEAANKAHNSALEAEEEVMEMMVWGEQALTLE
ncbi:hypothetical protein N665_0467s0001, partial [Sinapis alba]